MRRPDVDNVRVMERVYAPAAEPETNHNNSEDYLFVLPRTNGRMLLRGSDGTVLHDGGVGPGLIRVVAPGERSTMRALDSFESVMLALPAVTCHNLTDNDGTTRAEDMLGMRAVLRLRAPIHRLTPLIEDAAHTDDEDSRTLILSGIAMTLIGSVLDAVRRSTDRVRDPFDAEQLRRLIEFAEHRLGSELSLREWAAVVGLSSAEFGRRFVKSFGVAPYTWYLDRRIDTAMTYLRDSDMSISEAALLTGFSSQSHFTVAFGRRVGVPPGRWRDELLRPLA